MKNTDWICLPIKLDFLPKHVYDKAKKFVSPGDDYRELAKEIAKNEGIEPGCFVNRWFPRDQMDILMWIQEDPENPEYSDMLFEDDDFHQVNMRHDKLMSKIHKFLSSEPTYREAIPPTEVHFPPDAMYMTKEERDEMEGEDDDD